ncbi:hypothetical protein SEVIR_8G043050v4 [Setaria viridis]
MTLFTRGSSNPGRRAGSGFLVCLGITIILHQRLYIISRGSDGMRLPELQWSPLLTSRFSSWCRGRRGQASCDAGEVRGRSAAGSPAAAAARVRATRSSRSHVAGASLMRHARVTELGDVWVPSVSPSCLESVDGFFEAHGPWDRQHSGWMVGWVQFWSNLRHDTHTGWRANKQSKGPRATRRITEMAAAAPPRTGYDAPTSSCRRRQAAAPALHLLPRRRVPTAVVPFHLRSPPPAGHGATSDPPPTCDIQVRLFLARLFNSVFSGIRSPEVYCLTGPIGSSLCSFTKSVHQDGRTETE